MTSNMHGPITKFCKLRLNELKKLDEVDGFPYALEKLGAIKLLEVLIPDIERLESDTLSEVLENIVGITGNIELVFNSRKRGIWLAIFPGKDGTAGEGETPLEAALALEKKLIESKSSNP